MKKPKVFIQECGSYSDQILIIAGASKKEVISFNKKKKALDSFQKWIEKDFDEYNNLIKEKDKGLFCNNSEVPGVIIFLRPLNKKTDRWDYWETLMHEIHHLVLWLATKKQFLEEPENQAYLFEFLFRSIRRKLQGVDKI